jgi:hypothetical protein
MRVAVTFTIDCGDDLSPAQINQIMWLKEQLQADGHDVEAPAPLVVKETAPPPAPNPRGRPRKNPINGEEPLKKPADVQASGDDEDEDLGLADDGLDDVAKREKSMELARRFIVVKNQAGRDAIKKVIKHFGEPMFSKIPLDRAGELYKMMIVEAERLGVQA